MKLQSSCFHQHRSRNQPINHRLFFCLLLPFLLQQFPWKYQPAMIQSQVDQIVCQPLVPLLQVGFHLFASCRSTMIFTKRWQHKMNNVIHMRLQAETFSADKSKLLLEVSQKLYPKKYVNLLNFWHNLSIGELLKCNLPKCPNWTKRLE